MPWIIVTSHFPLHNTMLEEHAETSARHYVGDAGEDSVEGHEFTEHHFAACKGQRGAHLHEWRAHHDECARAEGLHGGVHVCAKLKP